MDVPLIKRIKNGWAAIGDGWAVHAATKEEALQLFTEAEERHAEIEQRKDSSQERETKKDAA